MITQQTFAHQKYDMPDGTDVAWCPGCGNFPILIALKKSLADCDIDPTNLVVVSGIGQAAKLPQYLKCHYFNGLHGRALPVATGIKATNPQLDVVVTSGDGDIYGEGGNHLIHTIRRNPNITILVHDNMIYGLTQGQAAPTSEVGLVTPTQPRGVFVDAINPMALAISLDAPFVARASAGDPAHLQTIIADAIAFEGLSIIDILQPCVVFNKVNTYQWFKEHTYYLPDNYKATDRTAAFAVATQEDQFALGVLYRNDTRAVFEQEVGIYDNDTRPLHQRQTAGDITTRQAIVKALLSSQ